MPTGERRSGRDSRFRCLGRGGLGPSRLTTLDQIDYDFVVDPAEGLDGDGQLELFRDTEDPLVAAHLAGRFAELDHPGVKYALLACLTDGRESGEVIRNALFSLDRLGAFRADGREEHLPALLRLLGREDEVMLVQAVRAIAKVDVHALLDWLDSGQGAAVAREVARRFVEANPTLERFRNVERRARELLGRGSVLVELDTATEGVVLPSPLGERPTVVLEFGWNLPKPIEDLTVDADGIRGTLSFGGNPAPCNVPWAAVLMLATHDGTKVRYDNACSFCSKPQREVKKLIAGEAVMICDECLGLCNDVFADAIPGWDQLEGHTNPLKSHPDQTCSFCGATESFKLVGGPGTVLICDHCVMLGNRIIADVVEREQWSEP